MLESVLESRGTLVLIYLWKYFVDAHPLFGIGGQAGNSDLRLIVWNFNYAVTNCRKSEMPLRKIKTL